MKHYKLIIFDWDGTLVDTIGLISRSIKYTAQTFGVVVPDDSTIRKFIAHNTSTDLLEILPTIKAQQAVDCYFRYYFSGQGEQLFPETVATLSILKQHDIALAIATNRQRAALDQAIQRHQLDGTFIAKYTPDDGYVKPDARIVQNLSAETGISCADIVMVGDSSCDLKLAHNAGIDAIAATYGLSTKEDLLPYEPVECINSIGELIAHVVI